MCRRPAGPLFLFLILFAVCAPGCAYPLDGLSQTAASSAAGLYSVNRLLTSYTGPVVRLVNVLGTMQQDMWADAYQNLWTGPSGTGMLAAQWIATSVTNTAALISATAPGTYGAYVTTWYDQSGNGNHATQTTSGNMPLYNATANFVDFNAATTQAYGEGAGFFNIPAAVVPLNTYYTISTQIANIIFLPGVQGNILLAGGTSANAQASFTGVCGFNWYNSDASCPQTPTNNTVLTVRYGGSNASLATPLTGAQRSYGVGVWSFQNGTSVGQTFNTNGGPYTWNGVAGSSNYLGRSINNLDYYKAQVFYVAVFKAALADADRSLVENSYAAPNVTAISAGGLVNLVKTGLNAYASSTYNLGGCNAVPTNIVNNSYLATHGSCDLNAADCSFWNAYESVGTYPWWTVDLGAVYNLYQVQIWNRPDNNVWTRFQNFNIYAGNAPQQSGTTTSPYFNNPLCYSFTGVQGPATYGVYPCVTTARYVTIQMQVSNSNTIVVALCNVAVWGSPVPQNQLVLSGLTATASSTSCQDGCGCEPPSQAVNNSYYASHGVCYSASNTCQFWAATGGSEGSTNYPWWTVDLGGVYSISSVQLWNRADGGQTRLQNFSLFAGMVPPPTGVISTTYLALGAGGGVAGRAAPQRWPCRRGAVHGDAHADGELGWPRLPHIERQRLLGGHAAGRGQRGWLCAKLGRRVLLRRRAVERQPPSPRVQQLLRPAVRVRTRTRARARDRACLYVLIACSF